MSSITLDFDALARAVRISGAGRLIRNPIFSAYIRKLRGRIGPDGVVEVPSTTETVLPIYQGLRKVLDKLAVGIDVGSNAHVELDRARREEDDFVRFSQHAKEIWNAQIDSEEFREFVARVEERCPGRLFYRKQLLSAFHLAFSQNGCNFSVPGSGKTSVVYAAFAYLNSLPNQDSKHVDRMLVVGPLSSFKPWEDEFAAVFGMRPRARRVSGTMTAPQRRAFLRGEDLLASQYELVLTSYQSLAVSEEDFQVFLAPPSPRTMLILDEAHYIKRDDGFWSAAAIRLAPLAVSRVVLTGTPAPNGYEDLVNLFRFVYPTRDVVKIPITTLKAMSDGALGSLVPELKNNIQPYYTRIKKADLGLPPIEEHTVDVPFGPTHEMIYRAIEGIIVPQLRALSQSGQSAVPRIRARLIRLRQASANPELLLRPIDADELFDVAPGSDFTLAETDIAETVRRFDPNVDLRRLDRCVELVRQILDEQGKVLIWSCFLGNLSLLSSALKKEAPFVEVLSGATPVSEGSTEIEPDIGSREDVINRFHKVGERAILIANPQAVAESISLHRACRSAIYFDRDFNAARFIQSRDRIHRYNPNGGLPVSYYYLANDLSIDRDIGQRLTTKIARLESLVDESEIPLLTAMDEGGLEDVRVILEAYERRKLT